MRFDRRTMLLAAACGCAPDDGPLLGSQMPDQPVVIGFAAPARCRAMLSAWWDDELHDPQSIPGRRPELFGAFFVAHEGLSTRCDDAYCPDWPRVETLEEGAGSPDVWVTVGRVGGRANAEGRVVTVNVDDDRFVLDHELGHALVGLADEYEEFEGAPTPMDDPMFGGHSSEPAIEFWALTRHVNVTVDPSGVKWAPLQGEPFEGGWRYEHDVYRPASTCRMRHSHDGFCYVCERAIEAFLVSVEANDGEPVCELRLDADLTMWEAYGTDHDGFDLEVTGDLDPVIKDGAFPKQQTMGLLPEGARWVRASCVDAEGEGQQVTAQISEGGVSFARELVR